MSGDSRPIRIYGSKVYFAEYRIPGREDLPSIELQPVESMLAPELNISQRYSRFGWLVVINDGKSKAGFRVCQFCGSAESAPPPWEKANRGKPVPHTNPISGRPCSGVPATYALGHKFMTDILELRFDGILAYQADEKTWLQILFRLILTRPTIKFSPLKFPITLKIKRGNLLFDVKVGSSSLVPSLIRFFRLIILWMANVKTLSPLPF